MERDIKVKLLLEYLDKLIALDSNGHSVEKSITNVKVELEQILLT